MHIPDQFRHRVRFKSATKNGGTASHSGDAASKNGDTASHSGNAATNNGEADSKAMNVAATTSWCHRVCWR